MDIKKEMEKTQEEFESLNAKKAEYQQSIIAIEDRQKQLQGRYALLQEMEAELTPVEETEEKKE